MFEPRTEMGRVGKKLSRLIVEKTSEMRTGGPQTLTRCASLYGLNIADPPTLSCL